MSYSLHPRSDDLAAERRCYPVLLEPGFALVRSNLAPDQTLNGYTQRLFDGIPRLLHLCASAIRGTGHALHTHAWCMSHRRSVAKELSRTNSVGPHHPSPCVTIPSNAPSSSLFSGRSAHGIPIHSQRVGGCEAVVVEVVGAAARSRHCAHGIHPTAATAYTVPWCCANTHNHPCVVTRGINDLNV